MDLGGIIAGALGGGAAQVVDIADKQIAKTQHLDIAKEISSLDEQKQLRVAEALQQQKVQAAQTERERVTGIIGSRTGFAASDAALAAGDVPTALAIADSETKGHVTTGYGAITKDRRGNIITDNASDLKADADQRRADAREAQAVRKQVSSRELLPEAAQLELKSLNKRDESIQAALDKAIVDPAADPKGVTALRTEQAGIRKRQMSIMARHGQLDAAGDAQEALALAKGDPVKLANAIDQAYALDGVKYGPLFLQTIKAAGGLPDRQNYGNEGRARPPVAAPAVVSSAVPASTASAAESPQASALDQARAASAAATSKLASYGSRQRQADPQGFIAAQKAAEAARKLEWEAHAAYAATVDPAMSRAAFGRGR